MFQTSRITPFAHLFYEENRRFTYLKFKPDHFRSKQLASENCSQNWGILHLYGCDYQ